MFSMIPVTCPHCGVNGQIMLPPLGAMIIGPCPKCDELVLVFLGKTLPLSKEIMTKGDLGQKAVYIQNVIMDHLDPKITQLVEQLGDEVLEGLHDYGSEVDDYKPEVSTALEEFKSPPMHYTARLPPGKKREPEISDNELDKFLRFDLPRIDNKDYFRAVFD